MYENLAVVALFAFLFSLVSGRLSKTIISGPIVFTGFGLIAGPIGLGLLDIDLDQETFQNLVDITLCLVLFTDAASADLHVLRKRLEIPQRMLLIGLPLIIALGIAVGALVFDGLSFYELALLATMLAATDAALGKGVVTNEAVPPRIRQGLNAESGLNDGLCVPVLLTFLALASGEAHVEEIGNMLAIKLVVEEIGIGLVVGLGITGIGFWLMKTCHRLGWINEIWLQVTVAALAVACFAAAQSLHGSGYIAAFAGGMLFGSLDKTKTHKHIKASEGVAETMALITWVAFGAGVVGQSFAFWSWEAMIYAILSLTLVRMLPIFVSLAGTGEPADSRLFMGWFGPRGLASIVFIMIVAEKQLPGGDILQVTVVCTVVLSILLHGLTANPLSNWLAMRAGRRRKDG